MLEKLNQLRMEFEGTLNSAFKIRTAELRKSVGIKTGKKRNLNQKEIKEKLKGLSIAIHEDEIKKLLKPHIQNKSIWVVEGWGAKNKVIAFKKWFKETNKDEKNFVYIFNGEKQPIYIGRTQNGKSRPANHFVKHWFGGVKSIDIIPLSKSRVPKIECLAIHYYRPSRNDMKHGSKQKYGRECFICKIHEKIDTDILHTLNKK